MNKIRKSLLWDISILSFIGILICYPRLPDQIPVHWNYKWEIDGLADKNYIFLLGAIPMIMLIVFEVLSFLDPRRENHNNHKKAYNRLKWIITFVFIVLDWITIVAALDLNMNVKVLLPLVMGFLFLVIGNYLPVMKSNFFVGIRNPWTLSDNMVWRKTHKIGGYLFILLGFLMLLMGLLQNSIVSGIVFGIMIIGMIGINVYSYLLFCKVRNKK